MTAAQISGVREMGLAWLLASGHLEQPVGASRLVLTGALLLCWLVEKDRGTGRHF